MSNIESKIAKDLQHLVNQYEAELGFLQNRNMRQFDTSGLPSIMKDMIKLATSKSPSFSNVSALSVANFVLSHLFGQCRPVINDPIYSDDVIGINTYGMVISKSGSGKDSTYQALSKATASALELINSMQRDEAEEKAKLSYCKAMKAANPEFDENTVTIEDFKDEVPKLEMAITSLASTRGGLTSSMNRMAKSQFGTKSIFSSELGMAIQSNSTIMEVLELFSVLFDMGQSVAPEFKGLESKEEAVDNAYTNLLGISSPTPFYQADGNVRKLLVPMLTTSLARRVTVVFSNAKEEFENKKIAGTPAENRSRQAEARQNVRELTLSIDELMLTAVKSIMDDGQIMFDEDAAIVYDDYKSYTNTLSELLLLKDGESVEGIEMAGRAFKMGRIAATWAMAQNKRTIDKQTLIAAIYFCDYTAEHLKRFAATLELKDYELFINDWEQGFFDNVLPIDEAITRGYITTRQVNKAALEGFLKPVNSRLAGRATVSYNDKDNAFVFIPVVTNTVSGDYSFRAISTFSDERPIHATHENRPAESLGKLTSKLSSFNPFVDDTTKFICLSITDSFLSMQQINKYLADTQHFISSIEPGNNHSFNLILPLNTVIGKAEYKFVCLSVAEQMMLKSLPELHEAESIYHGVNDSVQLTHQSDAKLFDVSGIVGNYASGSDVPLLTVKSKTKPAKNVVDKYLKDDILQNRSQIVDLIDASDLKILLFAGLVYDMSCHYVPMEKITDVVNNINSSLIESVNSGTLQEFILDPFKDL